GRGSIGKLADGSIYTGRFAQVDGTNGILDFGRPWTLRPTRLRGYYKYKTAPINYTSAEFEHLRNTPDVCSIYIAMTDWTAPFQIRTNPRNRQLFDPESPAVIAYGSLERNSDTDGWQEFTIELKYKSTSRLPRYIQITCAASKYGDYFTGGTGACLLVDQFSLEYDY
ncbi:MAG: PCMD domain-containing protein, partial [Muribaculaceae bacterium]|nr:PCMD domain-containing protein [Muribaculaceae bacterium]